MDVRRDLVISMGVMIALPLLLAANAIGLSMRMGPAIDRVIDDNVVSMRAAAEVIEIVAEVQADPAAPQVAERVDDAFSRLQTNITEEGENARIRAMEQAREAAVQGEPAAARDEVTEALALIDINIEAMHRRNEEARRLGYANAWVGVFAGLVAFIISRLIARRLRRRVAEPVSDLGAVLRRVRGGDPFSRCRSFDTSSELRGVLSSVNELLDERRFGAPREDGRGGTERSALLALLELQGAAACVLDHDGVLLAANTSMLTRLAGEGGDELRALLRRQEEHAESLIITQTHLLERSSGRIVILQEEGELSGGGGR